AVIDCRQASTAGETATERRRRFVPNTPRHTQRAAFAMIVPSAPPVEHPVTYRAALCITLHGCKTPLYCPPAHPSRRRPSRPPSFEPAAIAGGKTRVNAL